MSRLSKGSGTYSSLVKNICAFNPTLDQGAVEDGFELPINRLDVWQLDSMAEAAAALPRYLRYCPPKGKYAAAHIDNRETAARECMGDEARTAAMLAASDRLMEEAMVIEPRLARAARWHRAEEGDIACPALIAAGDDAPCFQRRRTAISESTGGQPVRLVISTDSNDIAPDTAAAFAAVVRFIQQWRTVEVWWQGAWLTTDRRAGWVFHVPLVTGGMDFSRLDFCLNSHRRDTLSFALMVARACEVTHRQWNGCATTAEYSHLPYDPDKLTTFIPHTGIRPSGLSIASWASYLLGFETEPGAEHFAESAKQTIPVEQSPSPVTTETAAQRAQRERDHKQWQAAQAKREAAAAAARLSSLSFNS